MPSIEEILKQDNFDDIVNILCKDTKEDRDPREYLREYNGERTRRPDSVGFREPKKVSIYSETEVDEKGFPLKIGEKTVPVAKVVTNTPKRIVRTAVAFMFGGKMTLSAEDPNEGFNEFKKLFVRKLKMLSVFRRFARIVLSETKGALVFYPAVKYASDGEKRETQIKCKILSTPLSEDRTCEFYPHFDDDGDMDAFIYKYNADVDGSNCECIMLQTAHTIINGVKKNGIWTLEKKPNLFKKISVVYAEVDDPEWEDIVNPMDKFEMRLSRVSDTNDYFSEPILKTYGLSNLPSKDTAGKELNFSIEIDPDTGQTYHGDAEYLAWQQSIDSIKEEFDRLKNEIDSGSSTPDLSFNNLQKIGNISGVARKFMLMEAFIKAAENMEVFEPVVQRAVSIVQAGMINISHIKYASQLKDNYIDVEFGTVLPEDLMEDLKNLETASQFNSMETIIKNSPYTDNVEEEVLRKKQDKKEESMNNSLPGFTFNE